MAADIVGMIEADGGEHVVETVNGATFTVSMDGDTVVITDATGNTANGRDRGRQAVERRRARHRYGPDAAVRPFGGILSLRWAASWATTAPLFVSRLACRKRTPGTADLGMRRSAIDRGALRPARRLLETSVMRHSTSALAIAALLAIGPAVAQQGEAPTNQQMRLVPPDARDGDRR